MMQAKEPGQSVLLLLDVIEILNQSSIPYAVVGAFAVSFYGVVRASMDADAVISLPSDKEKSVRALVDRLQKKSLKVTHREGDAQDPIGALIAVEDDFANRVDLLMNLKGMTDAVFSRTVEAKFMDSSVRFISLEDLIAMKLFAGSQRDLVDAEGILKVSYEQLQVPLLKELVQSYGKAALQKLEILLKDSKPR